MFTPSHHLTRRIHVPPSCSAPVAWAGALALAATLFAGPVHGQEPGGPVSDPPGVSEPGVVFNLGGGVGTQGAAGILSLGIPVGRGELVLRSGGTFSMELFGPSEGTTDLGLLYGVRKRGTRGWARVAGGVGIVGQDSTVPRQGRCDSWFGCYDVETRTRAGLLGQADAVWAFHQKFGLGVTLYGGVGLGGGGYGSLSVGLYIGRAGLVTSR